MWSECRLADLGDVGTLLAQDVRAGARASFRRRFQGSGRSCRWCGYRIEANGVPSMNNRTPILAAPADYVEWLTSLKGRITSARQRAALSVNEELVRLYHQIGGEILERQSRQGWGTRVIDRLASDLRDAFPEMKGFSSRNLKYMKVFAEMCPSLQIGQQPAAQLPWFHKRNWPASSMMARTSSR